MFSKNVGQTDRTIRGIVGAILVIAYFIVSGGLSWILLLAGIVFLATAVMGSCPPYALLGINTCKK